MTETATLARIKESDKREIGGRRWKSFIPLIPVAVVVVVSVLATVLVPFTPVGVVGPSSQAPNAVHWFGTDSSGMDVFSRTIAAAQVDLTIATIVTLISTALGILMGLGIGMSESAAGIPSRIAHAVARAVDLIEAIPAVVIGLAAVAFYGASMTTLIVALSIRMLPTQVRLVRTEVLRVRGEAYLDAARMAGMGEAELTFRHVLPNSSWAALQNAAVVFGVSIMTAAALGFIGAGMPAPTPEWGAMLAQGAGDALSGRWWSATFPAIALTLVVVAVSSALAPLSRRERGRS